MAEDRRLSYVYGGWEGYQQSLVSAISPLSEQNLRYGSNSGRRSVGEIAAHIAFGRIDWFTRMGAPQSSELMEEAVKFWQPGSEADKTITSDASQIVRWLEKSWGMVEYCLNLWTVADLEHSYHQPYAGKVFVVSRQWVIWRIMAHDIHHGGQLTILLAEQGIDPPDLSQNGGHIVELPVAE